MKQQINYQIRTDSESSTDFGLCNAQRGAYFRRSDDSKVLSLHPGTTRRWFVPCCQNHQQIQEAQRKQIRQKYRNQSCNFRYKILYV